MKKLFSAYLNTFSGLSREVWWLALITLVNRTGAMVIPFLSLYLREDLEFSISSVGWVMTCFGLGSFFGSWLGGKLTDIIGYYKVILYSLLISSVCFIAVQFVSSFVGICISFFVLISIMDASRPAFFVALSAYSKPENKTRSLTLIRLAINLGFSTGPALGGIIIASIGYAGLFWADALTCAAAGILMIQVLNPKRVKETDKEVLVENPLSPSSDKVYVLFLLVLVLFGVIFLQYISTMPLYYSEVHLLEESEIGLLLALNGFMIFVFEMPLINFLEKRGISSLNNVILGLLLVGGSFLLYEITPMVGILVFGMIVATLGEMIAFPFGNAFALSRSKLGRQGAYMGLYSMSFSMAHIFGHNGGMQLVSLIGYENTWLCMFGLTLVAFALLMYVRSRVKREQIKDQVVLAE